MTRGTNPGLCEVDPPFAGVFLVRFQLPAPDLGGVGAEVVTVSRA
jgi:hypothetical protein